MIIVADVHIVGVIVGHGSVVDVDIAVGGCSSSSGRRRIKKRVGLFLFLLLLVSPLPLLTLDTGQLGSGKPFDLHVACTLDQLADEDFGEAVDGSDDGGGNRLGEGLVC